MEPILGGMLLLLTMLICHISSWYDQRFLEVFAICLLSGAEDDIGWSLNNCTSGVEGWVMNFFNFFGTHHLILCLILCFFIFYFLLVLPYSHVDLFSVVVWFWISDALINAGFVPCVGRRKTGDSMISLLNIGWRLNDYTSGCMGGFMNFFILFIH